MAVDRKYGRVTIEHGSIGENEPVVVFRAQDKLLPAVLDYYQQLCAQAGSPQAHVSMLDETLRQVRVWQEENPVKVPESA